MTDQLGNNSRLTPRAAAMLASDPGPYLSCEACFRLLDQYVEDVVDNGRRVATDPELAAMPAHLASCAACREEAATVLLLVAEDRGVDGEALLAANDIAP
jgi:bacterioferritin-associated ferredoxin